MCGGDLKFDPRDWYDATEIAADWVIADFESTRAWETSETPAESGEIEAKASWNLALISLAAQVLKSIDLVRSPNDLLLAQTQTGSKQSRSSKVNCRKRDIIATFWGTADSASHEQDYLQTHPYPPPSRWKRVLTAQSLEDKLMVAPQAPNIETRVYNELPYHDSIRLLRIEPGINTPLECQLEITRLCQLSHTYEAISYVWGNRPDRVQISSLSGPLNTTWNLSDALHRLRLADRPRYVWADALCINQDDTNERSKQVRLMRFIYKHASQVLIWLGVDPAREAILAFSVLCGIASGIELKGRPVGQPSYTSNGVSSQRITHLPGHDTPPSVGSSLWVAVANLFENPWFWRVWCIQEVALASSALVIWGECEIAWRWLGLAAARIQANYYQILHRYKMSGVFNAYLVYRISQGEHDLHPISLSFSHLVALTRHFRATDPRDKIFGLLGLSATDSDPENGHLFIDPDYSLPAQIVYRNYAHKVLQSDRSLTLLSGVQHGQRLMNSVTWVPQLEQEYTRSLAPFEIDPNFSASADLDFEYQRMSDDIITLRGILISSVSHTLPTEIATSNDSSVFAISNLAQDTKLLPLFRNTQGQIRLSYTLTAGKAWDSNWTTDPESHLNDFAAFIRQSNPCLAHNFNAALKKSIKGVGRSVAISAVRELLEALRDAIRGHRSLLEDGKILHRDVSENNIIMTELPAEDALKGRLIDLDLAKELDGMPSGARHRTGTMQFMAIEVLEGKGHTYQHDLKSFFYVFVWMCIGCSMGTRG
ncbi:hypothetical protein G7Y89_g576 [Cudoniella acicularis]|uniref:EKC/KEOPS complex subunit BUD32 n=1 Tax=Cudoniella acicularis TaxID=354080 RepID=A0A8H4RXQ7_9HELO|nr:hypothetical protein G7Y89_g576 [Cudoniella acicularis]